MIAITFALPAESSGVAGLLRKKEIANDVAIVHTGVGRKSCERKIDDFLRAAQPRILISAGFAGGLRDDLNPSDIILAENFSDPALLSAAQNALEHRARTAIVFTSTAIVDSIDARNEIARTYDAAAVDMETEVIAQACAARSIPLLSLRVISDTARASLPAPPQVLFDIEQQRTNGAKLAAYLLTHPHRVIRLIRFARQIARARNALTAAIVSVLRELPS